MKLNYLDFYQELSEKNIVNEMLAFIDRLSRLDLDTEKKQLAINKLSIQSAKNFTTTEENKKEVFKNAVSDVRQTIKDFDLLKIKILVVVSNNSKMVKLNSGKEIDEIVNHFKLERQTIFDIDFIHHGSLENIKSKLYGFNPDMLHFIGHGTEKGILLSSRKSQRTELLESRQFLDVLKLTGSDLRFIYFNSCHSDTFIDELHAERPDLSLIGFKGEIDDRKAGEISGEFYNFFLEKEKDIKIACELFSIESEIMNNVYQGETYRQKLVFRLGQKPESPKVENRFQQFKNFFKGKFSKG